MFLIYLVEFKPYCMCILKPHTLWFLIYLVEFKRIIFILPRWYSFKFLIYLVEFKLPIPNSRIRCEGVPNLPCGI